jgi:PAS domain S-box-containing protein
VAEKIEPLKVRLKEKHLLKEKDDKFRLLFEDNPLPMWVFDRENLHFLEANQAAVSHYGYTREEFLGMTLAGVRPPEDVPRLIEALSRADGPAATGQWRHRRKGGSLLDVEVASHAISYAGRPAVLSVLLDITKRKQLEEHLHQSAKMEGVGMLAGGIAHDFNNLLTIINGYSQILLNDIPVNDRNHGAVEQIMKAGERAASLTRQLLSYSRRQAPQPKILDLNQVLHGMEAMLRRLIGEDIDLTFAAGSELGKVRADPGQLEQVVMNLAVNARDAMPRGGRLTLATRNVVVDLHAASTTLTSGNYVALEVRDSGSGMDAATRAHLFEPFFTTKAHGQGTGLGMTTVFTIVKQSGGIVDVRSAPDQGTSVGIYLPRIDQAAAPERHAPAVKAVRGSETILLVEDEEQVRHLLRNTLRADGYEVLDAPNAAAARQLGAAHKGPIHILVTDVVMPAEDGRELAFSLLPRRPEMKVLFMSGYTEQNIAQSGLPATHAAFIQKPFTPAALSIKVREILERNGHTSRAGV